MKPGIYEIFCKLNGRIYGGRTTSLENRKNQHFRSLNKNKHFNSLLQEDYNNLGKHHFEYRIVEECSIFELAKKEQEWLDVHWDANLPIEQRKCYNVENKACPITEETRKKLSVARLGKPNPAVSLALKKRTGENHPLYGKPYPWLIERNKQPDFIAKVREAIKYKCKKVKLVCLTSGEILNFDSIYQAGKLTKWCRQDISKFINGKQKQPKGFSWSYVHA